MRGFRSTKGISLNGVSLFDRKSEKKAFVDYVRCEEAMRGSLQHFENRLDEWPREFVLADELSLVESQF